MRILGAMMAASLLFTTSCSTTPRDNVIHYEDDSPVKDQKVGRQAANSQSQAEQLKAGENDPPTDQEDIEVAPSPPPNATVAEPPPVSQPASVAPPPVAEPSVASQPEPIAPPPVVQPPVVPQPPVLISRPAPVQAPEQEPPPARNVAPQPAKTSATDVKIVSLVYPGEATGHWVSENFSDGYFILLEDDSVWEIDSADTFDSSLWMSTESIVVIGTPYNDYVFYELVNTDTKEKVQATYLGQAVLQTQIEGDFEGWDGDTVFVLADGTILKQASYSYVNEYDYSPNVVVIDSGASYLLMVDGVEETVDVVALR
jgi:hypothetical protein